MTLEPKLATFLLMMLLPQTMMFGDWLVGYSSNRSATRLSYASVLIRSFQASALDSKDSILCYDARFFSYLICPARKITGGLGTLGVSA